MGCLGRNVRDAVESHEAAGCLGRNVRLAVESRDAAGCLGQNVRDAVESHEAVGCLGQNVRAAVESREAVRCLGRNVRDAVERGAGACRAALESWAAAGGEKRPSRGRGPTKVSRATGGLAGAMRPRLGEEARMKLWHITISSKRRLTMFPDERSWRRAVRRVIFVVGDVLVLYCFVDDHIHLVLFAEEAQVRRLAAALLFALRPLSSAPLEPPHIRAVESREHLEWLVRYFLDQVRKHQLRGHPALYSGSCFADLIGARSVGDFRPRIFEALPRLRPARACQIVGLPSTILTPASDAQVRAAGVTRIVAAAAAALCVGPDLRDKTAASIDARRVAVQLVDQVGASRLELPALLHVSPRSVRRLAHEPVPDRALRAARLQIAVADAVHALPPAARRTG